MIWQDQFFIAPSKQRGKQGAKPGSKGEGEYFRIIIRPKEEFSAFRIHDAGRTSHIQRLAPVDITVFSFLS